MSAVYLHVGQCGIQIGQELWTKAILRTQEDVDLKQVLWSGESPRCLFIDGERKVIQKFSHEMKKIKHKPSVDVLSNSIRCRKGCGANWSVGYHGLAQHTFGKDLPKIKAGYGQYLVDFDSSMLDVCMEAIRVKIESCDSFSGFIGFHGLGGGTGSGWGSRLCSELCDLYPTAYRLWNVINPHSTGESPTQHYNQILSLSKLQENADGIVLFENDHILDTLAKHCTTVSLKDMNNLIADTILSIYSPVSSLTPKVGGLSIGIEPWELIRSVAPLPARKLIQPRYVDDAQFSKTPAPLIWNKLLKTLTGRLRTEIHASASKSSCVSAVCVCRGVEKDFSPNLHHLATQLKQTYSCVDWNPYPFDVWIDEAKKIPAKGKRRSKSLTVCANVTASADYCQRVLEKSKLMFDNKAYLHWYNRHGTEENDFIAAFTTIETIIKEYKET
ncbi:unnamed protein product [Clavelina lepadiformis]|uniref:Tubulin delta chain n=1 Tax=Clavelina lepadiformis TaxID=159417 RepID=A0ABP0EX16_CLALP